MVVRKPRPAGMDDWTHWNHAPDGTLVAPAAAYASIFPAVQNLLLAARALGLTRQLAAELGAGGVSVISVNPGWVRTDMGGTRAPVTPQESVTGLLKLINGLPRRDSGRFFDHTGAALAW